MPFFSAFTIFTAIHFFTVSVCYCCSIIFATSMKFIVSFSCSFYTYIIISCIGNAFLNFLGKLNTSVNGIIFSSLKLTDISQVVNYALYAEM
jgi:hypothetical protein